MFGPKMLVLKIIKAQYLLFTEIIKTSPNIITISANFISSIAQFLSLSITKALVGRGIIRGG
ncbi:hypothetical protein J2X31_000630 [Flavobacterium arsenatis]|uniref:Uncharacterized protein n=1 Tax=Flavobacterium arsenatis TaxID=1484332 RepID=A0ABU1TKY0_9FLAO|nr:hypothetical protein [Flavobacterium arsenatis]